MVSRSSRSKPIPFRIALSCAGVISLLCAQPIPEGPPIPPCTSAANCNARGKAALTSRKFKEAITDFIEELSDAAEERAGDVALAFNNLSVSYLRQRNFLQARSGAQQAVDLSPENPSAIHNLAVINANLRSFTWPATPDGTYVLYAGCG